MNSHFWHRNVIILSFYLQRCSGSHNVSLILLLGVISLPDAKPHDQLCSILALHWAAM